MALLTEIITKYQQEANNRIAEVQQSNQGKPQPPMFIAPSKRNAGAMNQQVQSGSRDDIFLNISCTDKAVKKAQKKNYIPATAKHEGSIWQAPPMTQDDVEESSRQYQELMQQQHQEAEPEEAVSEGAPQTESVSSSDEKIKAFYSHLDQAQKLLEELKREAEKLNQ